MKEAVFVKKNTEKWAEYESTPTNDPDQLTERFYRTHRRPFLCPYFLPKATVQYLNGLTSQFHQKLFSNRKKTIERIAQFWQFELPLLMYEARFKLLYAFIFSLARVY
ncbi:MAG: hypothetical protein R2822_04255 [Spirosomataceae bacterium]